jgi:hypothetical protein
MRGKRSLHADASLRAPLTQTEPLASTRELRSTGIEHAGDQRELNGLIGYPYQMRGGGQGVAACA